MERVERRRRALAGAAANRMRADLEDEIQAFVRSLPVTDVRETVRTGTNLFVADARLAGVAQRTPVRIRIFASGSGLFVQVHVPRLRFYLTLPIDTDDQRRQIALALTETVLSRLD